MTAGEYCNREVIAKNWGQSTILSNIREKPCADLGNCKQSVTSCHLSPIYCLYSKEATALFELDTTT